jgi:hypothetical protein
MLRSRVHIYAASPFVHVYETKDAGDTAILSKSASKFATESLVGKIQGITTRCRLSWLADSALVYEPKWGGGGELQGLSQ